MQTQTRRYWTLMIPTLAVCWSGYWCSDAGAGSSQSPPNIIFIMVDDLGKEWIGSYGGENIATPHIDRLAETGMKFLNVYSLPQCTPTRATLLTGQYPFRHGWVNHWDVPRWGRGCHFDPEMNPSIGRVMKSAGYQTCIAGKWQINDFRIQPKILNELGFDEFCMWTGYESGVPASAERYWDPYLHTADGSRTYEEQFGPDICNRFVTDFIARQKRRQPFFIYYPMILTHGPLTTTPHKPNVARRDQHRAMVEYMDHLVGNVVEMLNDTGLRENTIIIWTTDNGTSGGISNRMNRRLVYGAKGKTLENGVCEPFVVNCPGVVPEGVMTDALTDFTDLLPTFAEVGGAELPSEYVIDGVSFAPLILGETAEGAREWIMAMGGGPATYDPDGRVINVYRYRDRVIRNKRFKLYVQTGNSFDFAPRWSPDGEWLLFVSGVHERWNPYIVRRDGTELRKIADLGGYKGWISFLDVPDFHNGSSDIPVWSTDGQSVFFTARVADNVELFQVTLEGVVTQLSKRPPGTLHYHIKPSADGLRLLYGSMRRGVRNLYIMDLADMSETQLTNLRAGHAAMWPHWQMSQD